MPQIRPFRALRFDPDRVGDLAPLLAPPYDVIGPEQHAALLARHPLNVVRLDLPSDETGDGPDDRYRRAARTLAVWRSDGTLRKDPRPSLYVYEQAYRVPGGGAERTQCGFFARLRLEAFRPGSGVLPHERTMAAPREDRYRLLRATGVNTSPVVGLYQDSSGDSARLLGALARGAAEVDVVDDDGVRHRIWPVAAASGAGSDDAVEGLLRAAVAGPITIADGHHRYETALRYRDERRMTRSCEEDPAFDYVLMLFLAAGQALTVLPTHRVVHGLAEAGLELLSRGLGDLFSVRPVESAAELARSFGGDGEGTGGAGRFGLVTRDRVAMLEARRAAFEPFLPAGGAALRRLDVTLLGVALERLCGIDAAAVAAGGRLSYTKSVGEAVELVADAVDGADAAFLVEPTPVANIVAVAQDGDVMPQKSTYFYPKPLTGLVINPLEW